MSVLKLLAKLRLHVISKEKTKEHLLQTSFIRSTTLQGRKKPYLQIFYIQALLEECHFPRLSADQKPHVSFLLPFIFVFS